MNRALGLVGFAVGDNVVSGEPIVSKVSSVWIVWFRLSNGFVVDC